MKKPFLILLIPMFSLFSCKKNYSCTCTETAELITGETTVNVSISQIEKATRAQAQAHCTEVVVNTYTEVGNSYTTECSLSK